MGVRKVDILKKENGIYKFDGKVLGKTLPDKVLAAWKQADLGPTPSGKKTCHAGRYVFTYKLDKKEVRKEGCAEGAEYGRFIRHIEVIRRHAQGN